MGLKVRGMNAVNERMIAEHPKPGVVRMVESRGLSVADKTLYLVERALGAVFQVLPERGAGSKRNLGSVHTR